MGLSVSACGLVFVRACVNSKGSCPCLFLLEEQEMFKSKDHMASFTVLFITCSTKVRRLVSVSQTIPVKYKTLPRGGE